SQHRGAFKVVLIGGDRDANYAAACRAQCNMLGLNELAIFAGQRPNAAAFLSEADFGLLPSRSEAAPLALIEYMAAGLPFIATRIGSIGAKASSLGLTEFVRPGDAQGLALALDSLLQLTPQQRRKRGAIGREAAWRYFDIRRVMPQWYAVYDAAVANKG